MSTNMCYTWETGVLDTSTLEETSGYQDISVGSPVTKKAFKSAEHWNPGSVTHTLTSCIPLVTTYSGNADHYSS